ncbi:MAG TPA: hypothetical protein VIM16_21405 [Mucilaginibacter sp.]|jgi:energy-coupling factor transporter transmembrane protein EcfT
MYKIGGILFCILEGILVANFGWMALLWSTIGFLIGLFVSANIILPILMGVPIAFFYLSKKQIRPKVFFALLRTPLIWFIVLFVFGWFFPSVVDWLSRNETLNIGVSFGFILIILSPISKETRKDFKSDFDKSYGRYYTEQNNFKLNFIDPSNKRQLKQIESAIKVFSNLYYHTISNSKDILLFKYSDSRFRYMIFCMSTFIKSCEGLLDTSDLLLKECLHFISATVTSKDSVQDFFNGPVNIEEVENRGLSYLNDFLENWTDYFNACKISDKNKATQIICSMIHSTESDEYMNESCIERLRPLAFEIEDFMPTMRDVFVELTEK